MKGVLKWVGSLKKQKPSGANWGNKEVFCFSEKHLDQDASNQEKSGQERKDNIEKLRDGQEVMDSFKKARPDSSGLGSYKLFHQPVLVAGLMEL